MDLNGRARQLLDLINQEDDTDKLCELVKELNDILQEEHRNRTQGMESPRIYYPTPKPSKA